jgi:hypothetical protein
MLTENVKALLKKPQGQGVQKPNTFVAVSYEPLVVAILPLVVCFNEVKLLSSLLHMLFLLLANRFSFLLLASWLHWSHLCSWFNNSWLLGHDLAQLLFRSL